MTDELAMLLDHLTLNVGDLARARAFYAAVLAPLGLAPLGLAVVGEGQAGGAGGVALAGFGIGRKGNLWLAERGRQTPAGHFAFRAASRQAVRAFHAAALANGGADNGPPGIRHGYHPAYYAAFVIDPEGHNVEAVCFEPEWQPDAAIQT